MKWGGVPMLTALLACCALLVFGLTCGADGAALPAFARALGGAAGHPLLLISSVLLFCMSLLGRALERSRAGERLPMLELAQSYAALASATCLTLAVLGVFRGWPVKSVAVLYLAALVELIIALLLGMLASLREDRDRRLYAGALCLTLFDLGAWCTLLVMSGRL
jgi:hypothetical protein